MYHAVCHDGDARVARRKMCWEQIENCIRETMFSIYTIYICNVRGAILYRLTQLLLQKLGSHALQARVSRIGQVLDSNGGAVSRIGIANRVALFPNVLVHCLSLVSAPTKKEKKRRKKLTMLQTSSVLGTQSWGMPLPSS